jgi:hypothetical protein
LLTEKSRRSRRQVLPIDPPRFVAFEKNGRLVRWLFVAILQRNRSVLQQSFDPLVNSSNEIAPLILSALMKKVGVALTFSTLWATSSSADSLSNRA